MGRIYVFKNKDGSVSCVPSFLTNRLRKDENLICKVNKPFNPYYVLKIKKYFEGKI